MNILITGGCGFLGQHLTATLEREIPQAKISILDIRPHEKYKTYIADITDYQEIKQAFKNQDIIIHAAGIVSFLRKDRELLFKVNVEGTRNVMRATKENGARLIHISSVAALGYLDDKKKTVNEDYKFDWRIAERKNKYYMISKKKADDIVGEEGVTVYPGLMYGPGDRRHTAKMISAVKNNKVPALTPGGTNVVDVRDVAEGITKIIKKDIGKGKYLLAGENITMEEAHRIAAEETGGKIPKIILPKWSRPLFSKTWRIFEMMNRRIDVTTDMVDSSFCYRYFSNEKAKKELGWEPKHTFRQTIKDTIKWMENETQE